MTEYRFRSTESFGMFHDLFVVAICIIANQSSVLLQAVYIAIESIFCFIYHFSFCTMEASDSGKILIFALSLPKYCWSGEIIYYLRQPSNRLSTTPNTMVFLLINCVNGFPMHCCQELPAVC